MSAHSQLITTSLVRVYISKRRYFYAKYLHGPNIDEPIRLENSSGICYYHYDALGSVTDLTGSSGQHIEHYYYSPFGETKIYSPTGLKRTISAYGNPYRFTGRRWDEERSLYYYRARMYDPRLGKFLQPDPIGYTAGDMNLCRYVGNNPLNLVDPLGLKGDDPNGPKRPDETWDEYWERKRRQRELKRLENALKRAKRLADLGMYGAAAKALGDYLADLGRIAPWLEGTGPHQIPAADWQEAFEQNVLDPIFEPNPWPDPDKSVIENWLNGVYDVIMPGGSLNPGDS